MKLGVFDSGLGGLTVVRRLRAVLPDADVVYYADQRNVPYGDRSDDDLRRLLAHNVEYLARHEVDAIVVGCNTSCAIASRYGWPAVTVPIFDLIAATAEGIAAQGFRRVGVVATTATAKAGAYGVAIRARSARAEVREVAAPALVPLVESGVVDGPPATQAVARACAPLAGAVDAVVLGCTHYPLLRASFAGVFGDGVAIVDPAELQADEVARWARGPRRSGSGTTRFVTSGDPLPFRAAIERFMGPLGPSDAVASDHAEQLEEDDDAGRTERAARDDLKHRVRL